jgi:hypothetical protein
MCPGGTGVSGHMNRLDTCRPSDTPTGCSSLPLAGLREGTLHSPSDGWGKVLAAASCQTNCLQDGVTAQNRNSPRCPIPPPAPPPHPPISLPYRRSPSSVRFPGDGRCLPWPPRRGPMRSGLSPPARGLPDHPRVSRPGCRPRAERGAQVPRNWVHVPRQSGYIGAGGHMFGGPIPGVGPCAPTDACGFAPELALVFPAHAFGGNVGTSRT